jgi:predicted phosphodiesterase
MKIRVLSDLHLEMGRKPTVPTVDSDLVVLAGDVHEGAKGVHWIRETFPNTPVVYVAGNHEYWGRPVPATLLGLQDAADRPSGGRASRGGVYFLERDVLGVRGVTVAGATLWTDFDLFGPGRRTAVMEACRQDVGDFQRIPSVHGGAIDPTAVRSWHRATRRWIREADASTDGDGPLVVVTHHAPTRRSVDLRYADRLTSAAFVAAAEDLVEEVNADLWIHGHVHASFDYVVGGTRVVANPRGHPGENDAYDGTLTIEV